MTAAALPAPVRERPILFKGRLVRAILEGRKTQTRRIAKFVPIAGYNLGFSGMSPGHFCTGVPASGHVLYSRRGDGVWEQRTEPLHCPYGAQGDRLWVKETWALSGSMADYMKADIDRVERASMAVDPRHAFGDNLVYRADGDGYDDATQHWRPSIFMRRWASRIDLEVTEVRVQRLQEISEEDAQAEGVEATPLLPSGQNPNPLWRPHCRSTFAKLWDSINEERGFGWGANPWVWAITFRRVRP